MKNGTIATIIAFCVLVLAAGGCLQEVEAQEGHGHHGGTCDDHNDECGGGHAKHRAGDQQGHGHGAAGQGHDHSTHGSTAPSQGTSDPVLSSYIAIQKALAADSTTGVAAAASRLSKAAAAHRSHGGSHGEIASGLIQASAAFQGANLATARAAFKTLSQRMIRYRGIMPAVLSQTYIVHCPMVNASWIQTTDQVENPFHGSSMLRCGEVIKGRGAR